MTDRERWFACDSHYWFVKRWGRRATLIRNDWRLAMCALMRRWPPIACPTTAEVAREAVALMEMYAMGETRPLLRSRPGLLARLGVGTREEHAVRRLLDTIRQPHSMYLRVVEIVAPRPEQAALLPHDIRCVFRCPFEQPKLARPDMSKASKAILTAIWDERDYALTPILADSLEDDGCESAELLSHLRTPHHVFGCWALRYLNESSVRRIAAASASRCP